MLIQSLTTYYAIDQSCHPDQDIHSLTDFQVFICLPTADGKLAKQAAQAPQWQTVVGCIGLASEPTIILRLQRAVFPAC